MLKIVRYILIFTFLFVVNGIVFGQEKSEQEKAKDPYANDLGSDKIDISSYPADKQQGYKLLLDKCSKCHTPNRPINSQFLELDEKEIEKQKKENPDIFKDKLIFQIDSTIWKRYVKRMMNKPGCDIKSDEGKSIWQFLVYDSINRKLNNKKEWINHRKKLLSEFKTKHPARYKELYEESK